MCTVITGQHGGQLSETIDWRIANTLAYTVGEKIRTFTDNNIAIEPGGNHDTRNTAFYKWGQLHDDLLCLRNQFCGQH